MDSSRKTGLLAADLLAVVFATLILSGIVFAQIQDAKGKASFVACSQNVKQLVLAITHYEQDKGHFPPGRKFLYASGKEGCVTDMVKWSNAIAPYFKMKSQAFSSMGDKATKKPAPELASHPLGDKDELYLRAYRCPSVSNWDMAGLNMSYGYNYQYLGNADPLSLVSGGKQKGFVRFPVSQTAIWRFDLTICVADSDGTGFKEYRSAAVDPSGPDISRRGAFAYLIDPTFLPSWDLGGGLVSSSPVYPGKENANIGPAAAGLRVSQVGKLVLASGNPAHQAYRSIISNRHDGKANIGFLDGHVELVIREKCYFERVQNVDGVDRLLLSNAFWNTYGLDNDLNGDGIIDPDFNERIVDQNEAFTKKGGKGLTESIKERYNPTPGGVGFEKYEDLIGSYLGFGPGFEIHTILDPKTESNLGPTLPHVPPFSLPEKGTSEDSK